LVETDFVFRSLKVFNSYEKIGFTQLSVHIPRNLPIPEQKCRLFS
jgi:hypothetical protein